MLISPEYLAQQKELHTNEKYGVASRRWINHVRVAIETFGAKSILDYGCGKGRLKEAIPEVVEYDPAIPGKDADPEPADLVVCTDVLEHIEPDNLDAVLQHIRSKTKCRLFFSIATCAAKKTLPDGRNAHLIIEPPEWWLDRLAPYFRVHEHDVMEGRQISGIAQPVSVVGSIKAIGVLKDERNDHTRANVIKTPRRIPDYPLPPHDKVALIVCYGPSLQKTWEGLEQQRKKLKATLVSVSGAHDFLRKHRITPDLHVECDPRPHKKDMLRKLSRKTEYYMASCCHPDVIDHVIKHDLTLWHLYNGEESLAIRDIKSEETCAMIPGGGSVGLRTITLLYFLGYRHFLIHGMDCSFSGDEQHAGSHSGKMQQPMQVNPAVKVGDRHIKSDHWYTTSATLVSYANHMLADLRLGRYPGCHFYWYGDGLLPEMVRLQNLQLKALTDDAAARGEAPAYGEPRDYFNMTGSEARNVEAA